MADCDLSTPDEIWYPIPSIPGYELSSDLRVRKPRTRWGPEGRHGKHVPVPGEWKIVSLSRSRGSLAFGYQRPGGDRTRWAKAYLHRVVGELAYGAIPEEVIVRHYDDDTDNNYAANLCFGTDADNAADRVRNGRSLKGEKNHKAKLDDPAVREIRYRLATEGCSGRKKRELSRDFGVSFGAINNIRYEKTWTHIL